MPNYDFDFETTADLEENILVEDEFEIPISVSIGEFSVETISNCNNRFHRIILSIDDNNIIDKLVNDCNVSNENLDLSISSGQKKIKIYCDGFDQNEIVKGKGKFNYNISLFPFSLTGPCAENVENIDHIINSTKQIIKNRINSLPKFKIIKS